MFDYKIKFKNFFPNLLGFAGLIPFLCAVISIILNFPNSNYFIEIAFIYGALILSFIGAIYWGISLQTYFSSVNTKININFLFLWSIMPCTFGFIYFLIISKHAKILIIIGFIVCQFVDEFMYYYNIFPKWFIKLRRFLTLIVVTCLFYCYISTL